MHPSLAVHRGSLAARALPVARRRVGRGRGTRAGSVAAPRPGDARGRSPGTATRGRVGVDGTARHARSEAPDRTRPGPDGPARGPRSRGDGSNRWAGTGDAGAHGTGTQAPPPGTPCQGVLPAHRYRDEDEAVRTRAAIHPWCRTARWVRRPRCGLVEPGGSSHPGGDLPSAAMAGAGGVNAADLRRKIATRVPPGPVTVALSGGADSAVLAWSLADRDDVVAVTIDHGLPGSAALVAAAERIASRLGLRHRVVTVAPRSASEGDLRTARLAALEAESAGWIVTGHTADDQGETVLGNLLRGAGPGGLAGIPVRRGRFIRPLLDVSRSDTRRLAAQLALPF